MKVISYSLFSGAYHFEMMAYIRTFYWNSRMNFFIYPDFRTHLEIDRKIYTDYQKLFDWLVENNTLDLHINEATPLLCEGMLWRMKPIWTIDISHVLCRDADAITTYNEAQVVQDWLETGAPFHAMHDNPAHGGLMGGMVGFDTARLKAIMGWNSWEEMVAGFDLSQRGSDQHLLNQKILPKIKDDLLLSKDVSKLPIMSLPQVDRRFWESNLTCRHVGSPGVVELEMIRFFKRFDLYQWKFDIIEKEYKNLFYWNL